MISLFNRDTAESRARAYCRSIGADPDEMVCGGRRMSVCMTRWQWYVAHSAADRTPVWS